MMHDVSRSTTTDRRYFGIAAAIVEKVEDDPASEGRVRLKLPWFDPTELTDWCRVATLFAGNGYGSSWTPEAGDEVLVGFEHGDIRVPIVLGGLYNGVDKPPTERTASKNQKLFRTKAGHQLVFDDSSGSMSIELVTKGGHALRLDDDKGSITLAVAKGASITLDQSGIKIDAGAGTVTVTGGTIKLN
jgi:uncharacterized protein involved in type VI secretion and phage assembly